MPDFSFLPEPLTLYILLQLTDLKALYAVILASPHVNAVFRLNARRIFKTVLARTLPDEFDASRRQYKSIGGRKIQDGLISPVLSYMSLRERLATSDEVLTKEQMLETIDDVVATALIDPWPRISTRTIFHTIAQAVRIHDLAYSILRSKLDYFETLKFERLADPKCRYKRPYDPAYHNFEGAVLEVQMPLSDPSWAEETRIIRVLWLLAAGWRASQHMTSSPSHQKGAMDTFQRAFLSHEPALMMNVAVEVAECLLTGPVLRPTHKSEKETMHTFDVLQTYSVQPMEHITRKGEAHIYPTSPRFAWIPVIAIDTTSEYAKDWKETIFDVRQESFELLMTRKHRRLYESPLQESRTESFDCLGFGFWDHRRTCMELRIRTLPPRLCEMLIQWGDSSLDSYRLSRSEQMFRLMKLYNQQEQREQQGWHQ